METRLASRSLLARFQQVCICVQYKLTNFPKFNIRHLRAGYGAAYTNTEQNNYYITKLFTNKTASVGFDSTGVTTKQETKSRDQSQQTCFIRSRWRRCCLKKI